jgi:hypothetical protein
MVSQVESCGADNGGDYTTPTNCSTGLVNTGLDVGTGAGQVTVVSVSAAGYVVTAKSKSNNTFTITKSSTTGVSSRSCATAGDGGCKTGGVW